jgi:hypothetical protein
MSRRGGIPILALVCFALAGCGDPPDDPEGEIGLMIDNAASAAQAGDLERLQAFVSPDYADEEGRDRRAANFLLRGLLGRYRNVLVSVSNLRVQLISSELATADMTVSLLARDSGRPVLTGIEADRLPLRLALRREGGEWRVTRAEWRERVPSGSGFSN